MATDHAFDLHFELFRKGIGHRSPQRVVGIDKRHISYAKIAKDFTDLSVVEVQMRRGFTWRVVTEATRGHYN